MVSICPLPSASFAAVPVWSNSVQLPRDFGLRIEFPHAFLATFAALSNQLKIFSCSWSLSRTQLSCHYHIPILLLLNFWAIHCSILVDLLRWWILDAHQAGSVMTASTAATAAPQLDSDGGPRRRTVPIHGGGGTDGVQDDNVIANCKGQMRGESPVERSRYLAELKRGQVVAGAASHRRKVVPVSVEAKRPSVLSIVSKICLLLVGLLWLGQMIWKWGDLRRSADPSFAILDYEGRIAGIEASFKRITQMLQVQLEVVDSKIGSEVGNVVSKLKQVEEKRMMSEKELRKLEARADDLYNSLAGLKDMGLLSRQEFDSFCNELRKSGRRVGSGKGISLDDVRDFAKEVVEEEIEKHAADGLGRVDYALASGGGKVVRHSEPYMSGKARDWLTVAMGRNGVHANAQKMLELSFGEPGQCFALQGSTGFVEIRLRTGIIPEAVTLEHVSKSVAYDRSTAPRDCQVSAWFEGHDDNPTNRSKKTLLLREFSYDLEKSNAQTFNVETTNLGVINMVRFDFLSNHGSSSLTCIYRFRVHGYEPSSV